MKNILFLSFYFRPDLSAGSFRNTLVAELISEKLELLGSGEKIIVVTAMPNRYGSFKVEADEVENLGNIIIHRISIGKHSSGLFQQAAIYFKYFRKVWSIQRQYKYSVIYASSSRLMTAFLASTLSFFYKKKLYLDIRDIFRESLLDLFSNRLLKGIGNFFLKGIEVFTFKNASIINVVTPDMVQYFEKFKKPVRCFTNGIDEVFFSYDFTNATANQKKVITFAGNIGKAQALDKVLPAFAQAFSEEIEIVIVGDGSGKSALIQAVKKHDISNITFLDPVPREKVLEFYKRSDYLFLHLDDKEAFYRAMPTKLFEYSATGKTIIAGLKGFAQEFVIKNIDNAIVFDSNDFHGLITKFRQHTPSGANRSAFLEKYRRKTILNKMVEDIWDLNTTDT